MSVAASDVKKLRDMTGAGMMDAKNALTEADGDIEKATAILREKGLAAAVKKSGRIAAEGIVESYIHMGGKIGVLVEVNCETDFVAKTDEFKAFVRDIAMHIAASNPQYVSDDEIDEAILKKEEEFLEAQAKREGKPEKVIQNIVQGRLNKFKEEITLLNQPFVKDTDQTVGDLVTEQISKIGENVSIRRFVRYEMGEGLEKRDEDFAKEVAEQTGK